MAKGSFTQALFDNYIHESEANRLICQNVLFEYYFLSNDEDVELAIEHIRADIPKLEAQQKYERCLMLKHILERFE